MNKTDLLAKIEAMAARKQQQNQPTEQPTETPKAEPTATPQTKVFKLDYFKIIWHEGRHIEGAIFENTTFTNWEDVQKTFVKLWEVNEKGSEGGYTKVKCEIKFTDNDPFINRIDITDKINNGDFNPSQMHITTYLLDIVEEPTPQLEQPTATEPTPETNNLTETPAILKQLLGIVDTIEESKDSSEIALKKASEQVEKAKAYILYLQSILPILEAKVKAMIEAKHKPNPIRIENTNNFQLN